MVKEDMSPKILEDFNLVSLKQTDLKNMFSPDNDEEIDYSPIKNSKLLNKNQLLSNSITSSIVSSSLRDPLIFFKESSSKGSFSDFTKEKFEISFGSEIQEETFQKEIFGDNYFYKVGEFFNSSEI
jgi:hypothetical protein